MTASGDARRGVRAGRGAEVFRYCVLERGKRRAQIPPGYATAQTLLRRKVILTFVMLRAKAMVQNLGVRPDNGCQPLNDLHVLGETK